jgi:electron transfer flavoprotein beta subunit
MAERHVMRIIVCVKQIAHTYARTGKELDRHYLSPDDVVFRINPYDELAVGAALRAGELAGGGRISLLTLGPIIAEAELKRCVALGADGVYQIDMAAEMDPWQKSAFLAKAIQKIGADLVLCGKESLDTRNGQVGALLGCRLNRPFVSNVRNLHKVSKEDGLLVERSAGRGKRELIRCLLPAVCSVDAGSIRLPVPTYDSVEKSRKLPVQKLIFDEDSVRPKAVRAHVGPPRPRPKAPSPPDVRLNAYDRTKQLLTGSSLEKKGEMLMGSIHSQVDGLISFLQSNDFLDTARKKPEG